MNVGIREEVLDTKSGPCPEARNPGVSHRTQPLVLIVDDEASMRDILSLHLQTSFQVMTARDGAEGFALALKHEPDLIMSDIRMPHRTGLDLCRDLRSSEVTHNIPVVMLTATDDQNMKLKCLAAGATDFLSKPCSGAELILRAQNLTRMHRQQQELSEQKKDLEEALNNLQHKDRQLMRQEKLASLGRMSAGLIHEINNPLNYALQGLQLLHQGIAQLPAAAKEEYHEILHDVEGGVGRVTQIIADLRGFTTNTGPECRQMLELQPLVETVIEFLGANSRADLQIKIEIPKGLSILADRNSMIQALTSVVSNALTAMEEKSYPEGESPRLEIQGGHHEEKVLLIIQDNGQGISPEIQDRIFDPFFTTRDVGQGMGLGLSICHSILADHGATIEVRSEPGLFSTFTLQFPPNRS